VGAGPFNLSLAALLAPTGFNARFFDKSAEFDWHPGLLFPEASIQVSYLKDLVTLVDPTSQYSFLAFLRAHKRLYRFINRSQPVSRKEFNQYLQWVADHSRVGSLLSRRPRLPFERLSAPPD
jgi:lysine/ornithine N-monooxygenase